MSQFARKMTIAISASLAAAFLTATLAEAQTRRAVPRTLTVKKRPFTDMGTVVPVGTQNRYVLDQMQPRRTDPTWYSNRGLYGKETLPGPLGVYAE